MDTQLIQTVLSAGAVSAVVSGTIGYFTAGRIERIKHQLSANQEREKRLGEAHNDLLKIKQSSTMDHGEAAKAPDAALATLIKSMNEDFDSATTIYKRIRPLMNKKYKSIIDKKLEEAEQVNEQCKGLLAAPIEEQNNALIRLLGARSQFITVLKEQVEAAYGEVSYG